MNKKRIVVISLAATALILAAVGIWLGIYLNSVQNYRDKVDKIVIGSFDISSIPDGVYRGECDVEFIYAKVEVNIIGGKIESIKLLSHENDRGEAAESIIQSVIENQSLDVDAVSGATNSSKVILNAIQNALKSAKS